MEPTTIAAILGALAAILVASNAFYSQMHRAKRLQDVVQMLSNKPALSVQTQENLEAIANRLSAQYRADLKQPRLRRYLFASVSSYLLAVGAAIVAQNSTEMNYSVGFWAATAIFGLLSSFAFIRYQARRKAFQEDVDTFEAPTDDELSNTAAAPPSN